MIQLVAPSMHVADAPAAPPADKRERIFRAAVRVIAARGYHEAKVGEIAAEAGVAYGLVYHYFGSKDALLETIFRESWGTFLRRLESIEEADAPAPDKLRWVAAIVLRSWTGDPDLVRVLIREVGRSPVIEDRIEEIRLAFDALERIVARGQAAGELRADIDPRLAATVAYGMLDEVLTGWVLGQLPSADRDVARAEAAVVSTLTAGFAPPRD